MEENDVEWEMFKFYWVGVGGGGVCTVYQAILPSKLLVRPPNKLLHKVGPNQLF